MCHRILAISLYVPGDEVLQDAQNRSLMINKDQPLGSTMQRKRKEEKWKTITHTTPPKNVLSNRKMEGTKIKSQHHKNGRHILVFTSKNLLTFYLQAINT